MGVRLETSRSWEEMGRSQTHCGGSFWENLDDVAPDR